MAWTAPATWVTGEVVTAAKLNEQVRDNMSALRSASVAQVGTVATTAITTSTWTSISFAFEVYDTDGIWTAGSPTRLAPTVAGFYRVSGSVNWASDATLTGSREARISFNGASTLVQDTRPAMNNTQSNQVSRLYYFNGSTDYAELQCWQSKGSNHNLSAAGAATWFDIVREGA